MDRLHNDQRLGFRGFRLLGWASRVSNLIFSRHYAETIARLRSELAQKEAVIQEQTSALLHSRKIFDRSSAAARLGVWQCRLPDNTLEWTDVVYDMFDLPRGSNLDRNEIVKCTQRRHQENSIRCGARRLLSVMVLRWTPKS